MGQAVAEIGAGGHPRDPAQYDHDGDDGEHYAREPEPETGGPLPPGVGGYSLGGRRRDHRDDDGGEPR